MDIVEKFPVQRVTREGKTEAEDIIVNEMPLTIILNNRELVTLLCSPADLEYLAIGFLLSEGLIESKNEIKRTTLDAKRGVVRVETEQDKGFASEIVFKRVITSSCGRGASFYSAADANVLKVESKIGISAAEVFTLVKEFLHHSQTYRTTGGVHSAALCNSKDILVFNEDIGRHNAVDKIFGRCLLTDMPTSGCMMVTSGRISSEIVLKAAKRDIPILISKSATTTNGIKLADDLGMTLIGFVRGERMNVYSHGWRVTAGLAKEMLP